MYALYMPLPEIVPVLAPAREPELGITVIIPVKDRVDELRRQLEALQPAISYCREPVEIVVVDDSDPATAQQHRQSCSRVGARYIRGPRHVGTKRNIGAVAARYDLLLFTDSDCRVPEDLLARYATRLRSSGPKVAAVTGPLIIAPGHSRVFKVMRRSELLLGDLERPLDWNQVPWAATANLAVKREAFELVGGFPPDSPSPLGGEDVALGLALTAAGLVIECDPNAIVTHDKGAAETLAAVAYRLTTYGRSELWLSAQNPAYRRTVANPISLAVLVEIIGTSLARRTHGVSLLSGPVALISVALLRAPSRMRQDRGLSAFAQSFACAGLEFLFDGAAFVAALQTGNPRLLFAGFWIPDEQKYRNAESQSARADVAA